MSEEGQGHVTGPKTHKHKAKFSSRRLNTILGIAVFCLLFGAIGLHFLFGSKAATPGSNAPATAAATGGEVCAGGAQANLLVSPYTVAPSPLGATTKVVKMAAGDHLDYNYEANTTYWFAPGKHTFGTGQYGQIIPKDNDYFVGAPGAYIDGQDKNNTAFTQHATGVTIAYLTIRNFVSPSNEFIVNHDSGENWTVTHNTIGPNAKGGAGLGLGNNSIVTYNCITKNGVYGINGYNAQTGGTVKNVKISYNQIDTNDIYTFTSGPAGPGCPGCGYDNYPTPDINVSECPYQQDCGLSGGAKFWEEVDMTFDHNVVTNNHHTGIWADTSNVNNVYDHNYFGGNWGVALWYEVSYNPTITNNTFVNNAIVDGARDKSQLNGAIYFSESGYDSRVDGGKGGGDSPYGKVAHISGNVFKDNWSGVALWENSNRYCSNGLPTNNCTLVNPAATSDPSKPNGAGGTCSKTKSNGGLEPNPPVHYVDTRDVSYDCRWRTQNVYIHDNAFSYTASGVNTFLRNLAQNGDDAAPKYPMSTNTCGVGNGCGLNSMISNSSSVAFWPHDLIPNAITFDQNNHFDHNIYTGDWRFDVNEMGGALMDSTTWQKAIGSTNKNSGDISADSTNHPAQDVNSTFNDVGAPPPDSTPPTVSLTKPASGATISGSAVAIAATADDDTGVTKVDFTLGGNNIASLTSSPYSFNWDSTGTTNGTYTLKAVAHDAAGNTAASKISVTVSNSTDTTPPVVTIDSPTSGATVNGTVTLTATASDNKQVASVKFKIRDASGSLLDKTVTTGPYTTTWDSKAVNNGDYTILAVATDSSGNKSVDSVYVTVANGDTTPPTAPTNLNATAPAYNKVVLTWTPSTDNKAVAGYYVFRTDGVTTHLPGLSCGTTCTYTDNTVLASTTYSYYVFAYDAAGNPSDISNMATIKTPDVVDTTKPSTPTNLRATAVSSSQINLTWTASTDNKGVAFYDIYHLQGTSLMPVGSVPGTATSFGETGLSSSTPIYYVVKARDAAGNSSNRSNSAYAITSPLANKGTIYGLTTSSTGDRLDGVSVVYYNDTIRHIVTSADSGHTEYNYLIGDIEPRSYDSLRYTYTGYCAKNVPVDLGVGQLLNLNVTLDTKQGKCL